MTDNSIIKWGLIVTLSLMAFAIPADAGERTMRDVEVTVYVRRAMYNAKDLMPWHLHTFMDHGTLTLRGEVPSDELAEKAEKITKKVRGVLKVNNEIRVIKDLVRWDADQDDTIVISPSPKPTPKTAMLPWWKSHQELLLEDQIPDRALDRAYANSRPLSPRSTGATVSLMLPRERSYEESTAGPVLVSRYIPARQIPTSVELAVAKLKRSDPRFHRLKLTTTNGIVTIEGRIDSGDLLTVLAQKVSRIPAVKRVRIQDIAIGE